MKRDISYKLLGIGLLLMMFNPNFAITGNAIGSVALGLSYLQIVGFLVVLLSILVFWMSTKDKFLNERVKDYISKL